MHKICNESAEHHRGTFWNDEGQSIPDIPEYQSIPEVPELQLEPRFIGTLSSRLEEGVMGLGATLEIIESFYIGFGSQFEFVWLHTQVR